MKGLAMLGLAVLLAGCSASMVASSKSVGGVRDGPEWGIVKYLNQGADFVIETRQASARDQMANFCRPQRYKVVETTTRPTTAFFVSGSGGNLAGGGGSFEYLYLKFICVP